MGGIERRGGDFAEETKRGWTGYDLENVLLGFPHEVMVCSGNMNAQNYITILLDRLIPYIKLYNQEGAVFQQDGAAPYRAAMTKQYLDDAGVDAMRWPARSPDLNSIGNVCGCVCPRPQILRKGTQYYHDLKKAIRRTIRAIDKPFLKKLSLSVSNRAITVIERQGRYTGY